MFVSYIYLAHNCILDLTFPISYTASITLKCNKSCFFVCFLCHSINYGVLQMIIYLKYIASTTKFTARQIALPATYITLSPSH